MGSATPRRSRTSSASTSSLIPAKLAGHEDPKIGRDSRATDSLCLGLWAEAFAAPDEEATYEVEATLFSTPLTAHLPR